jgi:hypothetical protein
LSIQRFEFPIFGASPSMPASSRQVVITGQWLKKASVAEEGLLEGETFPDPEDFLKTFRQSGAKADILTFAEKLPNTQPRHPYYWEWSNLAALPITAYSDWLKNQVEHDVRSAIKKAARLGVVVKTAEFGDAFVRGVKAIYDESPVRQGTRFWHYQKDLKTITNETSTYLDRSTFLGAYLKDQLIGFLQLIFRGKVEAVVFHSIALKKFAKLKPSNALIAKAVELCEQRGIAYMTYARYVYRDPQSSLTEFKRRNGFQKFLLPRYYIPLTAKGKLALKLRLHRPLADWIPSPVLTLQRNLRELYFRRRFQDPGHGVSSGRDQNQVPL